MIKNILRQKEAVTNPDVILQPLKNAGRETGIVIHFSAYKEIFRLAYLNPLPRNRMKKRYSHRRKHKPSGTAAVAAVAADRKTS